MAKIKLLTGVVEVGLFCNIAQAAYFGNQVLCLFTSTPSSVGVDIVQQDGSVTVKRAEGPKVIEERVAAP